MQAGRCPINLLAITQLFSSSFVELITIYLMRCSTPRWLNTVPARKRNACDLTTKRFSSNGKCFQFSLSTFPRWAFDCTLRESKQVSGWLLGRLFGDRWFNRAFRGSASKPPERKYTCTAVKVKRHWNYRGTKKMIYLIFLNVCYIFPSLPSLEALFTTR